jgi:hypothetical protein
LTEREKSTQYIGMTDPTSTDQIFDAAIAAIRGMENGEQEAVDLSMLSFQINQTPNSTNRWLEKLNASGVEAGEVERFLEGAEGDFLALKVLLPVGGVYNVEALKGIVAYGAKHDELPDLNKAYVLQAQAVYSLYYATPEELGIGGMEASEGEIKEARLGRAIDEYVTLIDIYCGSTSTLQPTTQKHFREHLAGVLSGAHLVGLIENVPGEIYHALSQLLLLEEEATGDKLHHAIIQTAAQAALCAGGIRLKEFLGYVNTANDKVVEASAKAMQKWAMSNGKRRLLGSALGELTKPRQLPLKPALSTLRYDMQRTGGG